MLQLPTTCNRCLLSLHTLLASLAVCVIATLRCNRQAQTISFIVSFFVFWSRHKPRVYKGVCNRNAVIFRESTPFLQGSCLVSISRACALIRLVLFIQASTSFHYLVSRAWDSHIAANCFTVSPPIFVLISRGCPNNSLPAFRLFPQNKTWGWPSKHERKHSPIRQLCESCVFH